MTAPLLFCACIVSSPWLILMTPRVDDSWETEILCCGPPLYDSATSQVGSDGNADEAFSPSRLLWTSGSRFYIRPGFLLVRFVYLDAVLLFRFRTPPFWFSASLVVVGFHTATCQWSWNKGGSATSGLIHSRFLLMMTHRGLHPHWFWSCTLNARPPSFTSPSWLTLHSLSFCEQVVRTVSCWPTPAPEAATSNHSSVTTKQVSPSLY